MCFRITGLDPAPCRRFYGLFDDALAAPAARCVHAHGAKRGRYAARIERA